MEAFIPVVSGLQDVITKIGQSHKVEFPQIVVIGSQSSGKSSVLESVVKRDFLPRGNGMVTRAPLLLHLVNVPENDPQRKEGTTMLDGDWAVFDHKENQKYTNFDEVRKEIENRTSQLTGNTKCITDVPIILRVFSHRVVDLSLVDLPGIIKVAVDGQPDDIDLQIEKLVHEYIRNPNSIILAVTAANVDVATSDALKYAKDVDPEGNRTLAVVTKLDLMDAGTNANDMLTGKIIEVKLGIIGVKLRSQADILSHKSMEDCLKDEEKFLRRNYSLLASKNGVKFLETKLHELLMNHIRDRLPQVKQNINAMISEIRHELEVYDPAVPEDKNGICLCILEEYKKHFAEAIEGNIETNELVGGARILNTFYSKFIPKLDAIDAKANLSEKEILTVIHNSTGAHSALLTPEIAFIKLVKRQIQNLEMPCLQCIKMVFEELTKIAETCYHKIIQKNPRYPKLCEKIFEVVSNLVRSRKEIIETFVKDLVANELAHINTRHPDFRDKALKALSDFLTQPVQENSALKEISLIEEGTNLKFQALDGKQDNLTILANKDSNLRANYPIIHQRSGSFTNGLAEIATEAQHSRIEQDQRLPTNQYTANQKKSSQWFYEVSSSSKNALAENRIPFPNQIPSIYASFNGNYSQNLPTNYNGEANRAIGLNSISIPGTEKKVVNELTDDDKRNLAIVEYLITHYFAVVRKNLQDMVPKTIMRLLVNYVKDEIYNELVKEITLNKNPKKLLSEGPTIKSRKKELKGMLDTLEEAGIKLAQIQDVSSGCIDGENESDEENDDDLQMNRKENGEVAHGYAQNGNFHRNMMGQYMGNPIDQQKIFELHKQYA